MKLKLHFATAWLAFTITAAAQVNIPNAGLENWSPASGTNTLIPNGWRSNSIFPGIQRVGNAHAGSYAMKLSVVQYFTGVGGADITYNYSFPQVSAPPSAYTFWAKVHLNGSDKVHVTADLMKSPSSLLIGDISYGLDALTSSNNNTAVWTQYTFTLQTSPMPVDSAFLRFQVYPCSDTASYVIVDDLAFVGGPTGIQELARESVIESVYPNPSNASGSMVYAIAEAAHVSLAVYDQLGNKMMTVFDESQPAGKYKADIDVSQLASGIYDASLLINGKRYSRKLVVYH